MVIGFLGELLDHLDAGFVAFLGLVLRIVNPVAVRIVSAGLGNDVGRTEIAGVANDFLQRPDPPAALERPPSAL